MKKLILCFLVLMFQFAFAQNSECYKIFSQDADSLFMNSLSAVASYPKFKISEIQSKNGYILFLYGQKFYLLTVTKRYQNQSEIKILPQNSDYSDSVEVSKILFALIDSQIKFQKLEYVK